MHYDEIAAVHYAAYRPPLHAMILSRLLSADDAFDVGLDVGCGTGYSTIALTRWCARVYGIDPSPEMLALATPHERARYREGAAERVPLANASADVVTFAGSLFYADIGTTGDELHRVCRENAIVMAYDFEILFEPILQRLDMEPEMEDSGYDHTVNFSGDSSFEELTVGRDRVALAATPSELAHLLLSDSSRYDRFVSRYGGADVQGALTAEIGSVTARPPLEAALFYSKYRVISGS